MLKLFTAGTATAATGKTVAVVLSKNGGAFGNPSAGAVTATELSSGWYYVDLSTTDTNTLGDIVVRGTATACDDAERLFAVVAATNRGMTNLSGDAFALLGTPAGASMSADLVNINAAVVDTLANSKYANGQVFLDTSLSESGNGTAFAPKHTWAGALEVTEDDPQLKAIHIATGSTVTLAASLSNYTLTGDNWTLALGGQALTNCTIEGATISGIGSGSGNVYRKCRIGTSTLPPGTLDDCIITTTGSTVVTLLSGAYVGELATDLVGTSTLPTIAFNSTTPTLVRVFSKNAALQITGIVAGSSYSTGGHGRLEFTSCTAGSGSARGEFSVTNNGTGTFTFDQTQLSGSRDVNNYGWNYDADGSTTPGSLIVKDPDGTTIVTKTLDRGGSLATLRGVS